MTRGSMSKEEIPKKLFFKISAKWDGKSGGTAFLHKSGREVFFDIPKDFGGRGRHPCPDELFLASLASCLMNTFLYMARRRYLEYVKDIEIEADCKVELDERNEYSVEDIELLVTTRASGKSLQAIKYLWEVAYEYCHLLKLIRKTTNVRLKVKFVDEEIDG